MKIVKDSRVREYELTFLLSAELAVDEVKQLVTAIGDLVKKNHGTIAATEEWGKKELSYPIKFKGSFHRQAIYTHLIIEFDSKHVQGFEQDLYLMPEIMRHLLVTAEKGQVSPQVTTQSTTPSETKNSDQNEKKADEKEKN